MLKRRQPLHHYLFFITINAFVLPSISTSVLASDALPLLAFKSKADLGNTLPFSSNRTFCKWQGITCVRGRVVRLVLEDFSLGGNFLPDTLTRLDQLRVLSLQNNSLAGPIPNLSGLVNLKSLFLDHNSFTGYFPASISSLHRLRTIDLSFNRLVGPIPTWVINLDRLYYLHLELNRFNGTVPPLNQSSLQTFNVSGNNLSGAIPVTTTLLHFLPSSFSHNPGLCGEIIHKECHPGPPFFGPSSATAPPEVVVKPHEQVHGARDFPQPYPKKHNRTAVIIGFSSGIFVLVISLLFFLIALKKQGRRNRNKKVLTPIIAADSAATAHALAVMRLEEENELEEKVKKKVQGLQVVKSGNLVFCAGESQVYSLEQLMRGSAELLGRGSIGTTYKAVLDNRLIVCVKRLDASKTAGTSRDVFEQHMESVGGLRHPNLVPLRAYFQAKEEKLLVYDYQPNGSLSSLIHGSKSTRAKPLHWTSCLKIAEDVAQGLSYIHQAWRLVHGNLKSSNVLLGPDFEACLTDYCLAVMVSPLSDDHQNLDSSGYEAPEIQNSSHPATPKSDVYAFGILLVELLTGKVPSQQPYLMPNDVMNWVRSTREGDDSGEENQLGMLVEVAIACSVKSPEQRPTMWQVLKMIQEIKETVLVEDTELEPSTEVS